MQKHAAGVSVLLCTFNGAARLPETLVCLANQHPLPSAAWEIILVDNASTDATAEIARQVWADLGSPAPLWVLQEPRSGKQFALELAVAQARYAYTCIVDDDNRIAADYLVTGYELLEGNTSIGILGGPNTATFEGEAPVWFGDFQQCYAVGPQIDYVSGQFRPLLDGNVGRNVLWGAGMFVRTAVWQALAAVGFRSLLSGRQGENNLTAGEDDELCYAALLLGFEIWYSSRLHLRHHMTAGRLTESYRDRLFYASAHSATRLNAYRNALWGQQEAAIGTNLLKDVGYTTLGVIKDVLSPAFVRANLDGHYIVRMKQWHALTVVKDVLVNFKQVKGYYEQVRRLQGQLQGSMVPPQQTAYV